MRSATPGGWVVRIVAGVAGVVNIGIGVWALADPASFFARLALFPPYNQHLFHDIGAFQLGLGAGLLLALLWSDALLVVLAGSAAASVAHFGSHVVDTNLGGNPAVDLPSLGLLALALVLAAALRYRQLRPG